MKKNLILITAISAAMSSMAYANTDEFVLGQITVSGSAETKKSEATIIDAQEMQDQGLTDVGQALQRVPGVVLDMGGRRAETKAQIRGFDSRQLTLNLDGIPVYMPYDGNVDLSRYLTGELSKIEVQKSLGSLMLGPNNMGGSINLVSRKPTKEMEGKLTAGIEAGRNGIFSNFQSLQVGSKLNELFYIQAGMSQVETGNYPLSDSYRPKADTTPGKFGDRVHPKGDRIHSGSENSNQSIKIGFTPNSTDEYVVGYQSIKGSKEAPWYAHPEEKNNTYWDWPVWDKESLYFLSHTQFGDTYLKTRFYKDNFQNRLNGYDDDQYKTVSRTQGRFTRSMYDDETIGGHLELGSKFGAHQVKGIFQAKYDEHTEQDLGKDGQPAKPWEIYKTEIYSLGAEDRWQVTNATAVTFGYRVDQHQVTKVVDPSNSPTSDKNVKHNFQIKAEHKLENHTLFGGFSMKSRFPSPKDVVSRRFDSYEPNHNLNAETAKHFEIGSLGKLGKVSYQANLFYSQVEDAIEGVRLKTGESCSGDSTGSNFSCSQNQNVGEATHYGAELSVNFPMTTNTSLDVSYAYLEKELKDKKLKATNSPKHQALITLNYFPTDNLDLSADLQLASDREVATDGKEQVAGYGLVHLRGSYQFNKNLRANLAVKNAFDNNYELSKGDPRPGRTYWLSLTADF